MELTIYNQAGEADGSIELPESLFAQPLRPDLLHRAVTAARHNARTSVAHTKNRAERRGGGAKPWRQKGTGRARHGSIRSPLWRKGGVTFGPRNTRNLKKKVNKKEKRAALVSALSAKHDDSEVVLLDELSWDEPSAASARDLLDALSTADDALTELGDRRRNTALILVPELTETIKLSFRNFGNLKVQTAQDVNALDLLTYKFTVIVDPATVFSTLENRLGVTEPAAA